LIRAYRIPKSSEPSNGRTADALRLDSLPNPQPLPGQVIVRMRAASLNFRDQAIVAGDYPMAASDRDVIPLSDGAGEVIAVGEGVARTQVGDRVAGTFFQTLRHPLATQPVALGAAMDGVLAEEVAFYEDGVVPIPAGYSFEEAACLPCAAVTAWHGLFRMGRPITPGSLVLTQGTGGVSMFALQFARAAGAHVIATSSSDDKLARTRQLGAQVGINYRTTPDWDKEVLRMTSGRGVDCVVEVGGVGTLQRSINAVGPGGKIVMIGLLTGRDGGVNPYPLMFKGAALHGVYVGDREMFLEMNRAIEVTGVKPVVDRVFPFEDAREAYKYQAAGKMIGKVVIKI
jgi:NADPH:quinone reductase-like Zn-dependent oxidoreductase